MAAATRKNAAEEMSPGIVIGFETSFDFFISTVNLELTFSG